MSDARPTPAAMEFAAPATWTLSGHWTALGIGDLAKEKDAPARQRASGTLVIDGSRVGALDSVGALLIERRLVRAGPGERKQADVEWRGWRPAHLRLLERIGQQPPTSVPRAPPPPSWVARLGRSGAGMVAEAIALLGLVGECAIASWAAIRDPRRMRWRPFLHHVGVAGLSALPIVGLLSFLLGIVVAYQGAGQLERYGANVFVVDLVSLSMLREFAPLITAIIVAGRSGAAYAAQLGTMVVTEEIDALRALGISPVELLVLPRVFALLIVLPLLTTFADVLGVVGGMIMARARLGVDYAGFMDRLPHAVDASTLLLGVGKAPIFAAIIVVVGCFQGLRTRGGADSVGTQTTRAVVQSIFLVIVADALFSVAFSMLGL
jgi:phospholipid/cholesterol/gamma-HCH transport system permease protein